MCHKQEANSTKQTVSVVVSLSWNHSWRCNWFISARSVWFLAACCHIIKVFHKPFSVLLAITLWPSLGTTNGEQSQYRYHHRLTSQPQSQDHVTLLKDSRLFLSLSNKFENVLPYFLMYFLRLVCLWEFLYKPVGDAVLTIPTPNNNSKVLWGIFRCTC